jgi:putative toxin-antitoxin system antitoxin component (TIGR02293 family)
MSTGVEHLINKLKDPKQEMKLVRNGLKITLIESFLHQQELPIKDVLNRLNISSSTYFSKKKNHKNLDAYTSEKFIRLISVLIISSNIFGESEAKNWLYRKIPSLDNEVPINLLDTEAGHRLVTQALLQIKYGVYS